METPHRAVPDGALRTLQNGALTVTAPAARGVATLGDLARGVVCGGIVAVATSALLGSVPLGVLVASAAAVGVGVGGVSLRRHLPPVRLTQKRLIGGQLFGPSEPTVEVEQIYAAQTLVRFGDDAVPVVHLYVQRVDDTRFRLTGPFLRDDDAVWMADALMDHLEQVGILVEPESVAQVEPSEPAEAAAVPPPEPSEAEPVEEVVEPTLDVVDDGILVAVSARDDAEPVSTALTRAGVVMVEASPEGLDIDGRPVPPGRVTRLWVEADPDDGWVLLLEIDGSEQVRLFSRVPTRAEADSVCQRLMERIRSS